MRRSQVVAALWAIVLLSPAVTWWLVGDLSTVPEELGRDYLYRPPEISGSEELIFGIVFIPGMIILAAVQWYLGSRRPGEQVGGRLAARGEPE